MSSLFIDPALPGRDRAAKFAKVVKKG